MRAVVDTGVLISALIKRQGTTGDVLLALRDARFIIKERRKTPPSGVGIYGAL